MMDGIIVIDKKAGVTSREVDNRAKKLLDESGVGHLGTLDPFATGVLVLGVGRGTKLFPFMEDLHKTYRAVLVLGERKDTGELSGQTLETKEVPPLSREAVRSVLAGFLGVIQQIPPQYSAKHVDGKRAYEIARQGGKVELKPQTVHIYSIALDDLSAGRITFTAEVSRGTYIRTLGEDIAARLGTVGYLESLRRTEVGPFKCEAGVDIEAISDKSLLSLEAASSFLPTVVVEGLQEKMAAQGGRLFLESEAPLLRVLSSSHHLMGIYGREKGGSYRCLRGFVGSTARLLKS